MYKKLVVLVCMFGLLFGNVATVHASQSPVVSKTCGVGYSLQSGKCKPITTQRKIVEKNSKKISAAFICLGLKDWTPAKHKACMASKGYK
jgi:hypothetical protein